MEREYYIRGKKVTVEEISGVLAIKLEKKPEKSINEIAKQFGRLATKTPRKNEEAFKILPQENEAFTRAGWILVRPSTKIDRAAKARELPEGVTHIGKIFRQSNGHILIGTDRLTVQLNSEISETESESILKNHNLEILRQLKFARNQYVVRVPTSQDPLDLAVELQQDSAFIFAEPQMIEHIPVRFTPTDPDYDKQWQWNNDGIGGGTAGADVDAEDAWDFTRGIGLRVALIDTSIDVAHNDLAAAIVAGTGYFEDDGAGGADFVLGTINFPSGNHGTFCSGIATARANNGNGGCGIANQADLLAIACLTDQTGTQETLARAIAYAADPTNEATAVAAGLTAADGADVISCSLGPNGADWTMTTVLQNAIDSAITNGRGGLGTSIFWAVTNGNFTLDGADGTDEVVSYANTIAVGRSTRNDTHDNSGHGLELDFLAPGVDVYSTESGNNYGVDTGTSYAAPCAAGVGALILAVNPDLTWNQVRQIIRDTCDKVGGVVYGADGHHDRYGFGRINAARAVCHAGFNHELETLSLSFNDIPEGETTFRAIVFSVLSCRAVTFQITNGPTITSGPAGTNFGTPLGISTSLGETTDFSMPRYARIWISYIGTNNGDIASGSVTVRCVETNEEWVIPITANTISRPTATVMLVLDQSNSMSFDSGLGPGITRGDVLKFSAPPFVDVIDDDNAIGIINFDHDPHDVMPVTSVIPLGRLNANGHIAAYSHNPNGWTSIGEAVVRAHDLLDPVSGYDIKAMIILTDGRENHDGYNRRYISDITDLINEHVYAIGLGTAENIQPSALQALCNGHEGYLLMTGALDIDAYFRLAKYYQQILAGVENKDIIVDPEGWVKPNQTQRIPFRISETDISTDVILLTPAPYMFKFSLETPKGDVIDPGVATVNPMISYLVGSDVSYYRLILPVAIGGGEAREGTWHAVLTIDDKYHDKYLAKLDNYPEEYQQVLAHGVHYNLSVHSYSNLRLRASLSQTGYEPGAKLIVRVTITEYGLPVESRANVQSELKRPDNTATTLTLVEVEPGVFETSTLAAMSGIYRFRVLGSGQTLRGRRFTREQTLTGAVWRRGDDPPPSIKEDPQKRDEHLCKFFICLMNEKVLGKYLAEKGINVDSVKECLKSFCGDPQSIVKEGLTMAGPEITQVLAEPRVSKALSDLLKSMGCRLKAD